MKRCILCLLVCLVAVGGVSAAEAKKPAPAAAHPVMQGIDLLLAHLPRLVREGAELYCIRLEFIGHLYRKTERDGAVDESLERLGRTVRTIGMAGLDAVVSVREKFPYYDMMEKVRGWRKGKGKGGAQPGRNAAARDLGKRVGQGIRKRLDRVGMLRRQVTEMLRSLRLTDEQRQDLKLEAVTITPAIIRGGAAIMADAMDLGRELMKKEIPVKSCAERIVRISDEVKTAATSALDLAFALKAKLSKAQQKRLMANLPLRLIFFR